MAIEGKERDGQSRELFIESVLTNMQSGIIATDQEMRITLVNPYVTKKFGCEEHELLGSSLASICPTLMQRFAAGIDAGEVTISRNNRDGIIGYRRFDLTRADGSFEGHIISFIDLTEIIKVRQEMRLKERLATVGEIVVRVAHEIRNPLFGMTAAAQILLRELKLVGGHRELMDSLLREAARLNRLVEDLLTCCREPKLVKRSFELWKVVEEIVTLSSADGKRVVAHHPGAELMVCADREKVVQVVLNVVKNALEAVEATGSVKVQMRWDESMVSVLVEDDGLGIPEDILGKVFDIFYTTKRNGSGLGLAISRTLIEANGGSISCHNNGQRGATFVISLPIDRGSQ